MVPRLRQGQSHPLAQACAWALLALLVGGLQGCSGGNSSPAPTGIAGVWTAQVFGSEEHLLILPSASFRNLSSVDLNQVSGSGAVNGNAASGTGLNFPNALEVAGGATNQQATLQGTVTYQSTIVGTLQIGAAPSPQATYTYDPGDNTPTQLIDLAGNYEAGPGTASSNLATAITLQLNAAGTQAVLSGGDANGGTLTGSLAQVAPNLNAFTVNCTLQRKGQGTATFQGLAYLDKDNASPTLVFMTDNTGSLGTTNGTQLSALFAKVLPPALGTTPTVDPRLAGAYQGPVGEDEVKGLVFPDGTFLFGSPDSGHVQAGTVGLPGSSASLLAGSGVNYLTPYEIAEGGSSVPFTLQAEAGPSSSYSFDFYPASGTNGVTVAGALAPDPSMIPLTSANLGDLAGTYAFYDEDAKTEFTCVIAVGAAPGQTTLSVASMTMSDAAGNTFIGQGTLYADLAVLTGTFTYTGSGTPSPATYTAAAYVATGGNGAPALIIIGYDPVHGAALYGECELPPAVADELANPI